MGFKPSIVVNDPLDKLLRAADIEIGQHFIFVKSRQRVYQRTSSSHVQVVGEESPPETFRLERLDAYSDAVLPVRITEIHVEIDR